MGSSAFQGLAEGALSRGGEAHDPRPRLGARPTQVVDPAQEGGAHAAGEVVAAFAPVEAEAALRTASVAVRRFDPQLGEETLSGGRQPQRALAMPEATALLQPLEGEDPEVAREMVVADPRLAQRRIAGARFQANGPGAV